MNKKTFIKGLGYLLAIGVGGALGSFIMYKLTDREAEDLESALQSLEDIFHGNLDKAVECEDIISADIYEDITKTVRYINNSNYNRYSSSTPITGIDASASGDYLRDTIRILKEDYYRHKCSYDNAIDAWTQSTAKALMNKAAWAHNHLLMCHKKSIEKAFGRTDVPMLAIQK